MNCSIIIPHYRNWKVTLHCLYRIFKHKGKHDIQVIVVDNNAGDGSIENISAFKDQITILSYPKHLIQSHGCAVDHAVPFIKNEVFIMVESDSFPIKDGWLDYYEQLIKEGFHAAGSLLRLSGGEFVHPCGAMYRKSVWQQAKRFADNIPYYYYPNMARKEGFDCHLMVRKDFVNEFLSNPESHINLAESYKPFNTTDAEIKRTYYLPMTGVFHNGMGKNQESVKTYGNRCITTEVPSIGLTGGDDLIFRAGYEPGEWFSFWMLAAGLKVYDIPTQIKWMPTRENQQQEFTIMENGFCHAWGLTSYYEGDIPAGMEDIYNNRRKLVEDLYNSIPENKKPRT